MKIEDKDLIRHHSIEYPMELGAPKFEPIQIQEKKDLMINVARSAARKEYDRIMELVHVLQKQANELMRRMEITEIIHQAEHKFAPIVGKNYWLINNKMTNKYELVKSGPNDWSAGHPDHYEYFAEVRCLGDQTWEEVSPYSTAGSAPDL